MKIYSSDRSTDTYEIECGAAEGDEESGSEEGFVTITISCTPAADTEEGWYGSLKLEPAGAEELIKSLQIATRIAREYPLSLEHT